MIRYILLYSCFLFMLGSCSENNSSRGIDSKEVAQEIKNREVRHIPQAQIVETATQKGQLISDTIQATLTHTLTRVLQEKGIEEAAKYCNLEKLESVKGLEKQYLATIKRARLKGKKSGQKLNEMEAQLLDAYRYNAENNLPLENNVQKSGPEYLLFTAPITLNNSVCLKCHGKVGQDISENDWLILQKAYKLDSLVNYQQNQPIAIYSILFQRKGIIADL
ncbi:DUF3365 domain-containing protein [Rhodocytophaga rosea]|uniref:DUF3365 domain-containing protein n=1 Tax=Rhodocytophaga rosea TaxID=2704465 RepID=A0A6C0GPA7_9BACT|nr:DUF3365 domain-containing protein [Rhodocytophaga rosea]QHT69460.1 DUF3365 domain-containing protein [Rhodocytophaga rosea]